MFDPTEALVRAKEDEGLLYWRTDTHWNQKGSYLAFTAMMERLNLKYPQIQFRLGGVYNGDLIEVSNLYDFVMHNDDNWKQNDLTDESIEIVAELRQQNPSHVFKAKWKGTVRNELGLNDLSVWVLGDSFTNTIKPYLNASFSNIKYMGHWYDTIDDLPSILSESNEKPDLVIIVRSERSF
mgnify:CR=1 FL=1